MFNEDDFDFWQWPVTHYVNAKPLKQYLQEIESLVLGQPVTGIHTMGCIYNYWDYDDDGFLPEGEHLRLDEPVVIDLDGLHLDICFMNTSSAKIALNTLTMEEKSYQGFDWRNVSHYFPHIIGQTVTDLVLITNNEGFYDSVFTGPGDRPNGGDYFDELYIVMNNGYVIEMYGECEYMWIAEKNADSLVTFPSDRRLYLEDSVRKASGTDYLSLVPVGIRDNKSQELIHIFEDDFDALHMAIRSVVPRFDMYDRNKISVKKWEDIIRAWGLLCGADSFDEVLEVFCGIPLDGDYCHRLTKLPYAHASIVLVHYLHVVKVVDENGNLSFDIRSHRGKDQSMDFWRVTTVEGKKILEFYPRKEINDMVRRFIAAYHQRNLDFLQAIMTTGADVREQGGGVFLNSELYSYLSYLYDNYGAMQLAYVQEFAHRITSICWTPTNSF